MKYLNLQNIMAKAMVIAGFVIANTATTDIVCAQTTNFSGTWKRSEKSNAGELSINSIPTRLEISQDDKSITIKKASRNGNGETSIFTETLKFDGSLSESVTASKTKRTSIAEWSLDHKTLNQIVTSKDEQGNIIQIYKYGWTLEDDGKTIKRVTDLEIKDGSHKGNYEMQEIFNKQ